MVRHQSLHVLAKTTVDAGESAHTPTDHDPPRADAQMRASVGDEPLTRACVSRLDLGHVVGSGHGCLQAARGPRCA